MAAASKFSDMYCRCILPMLIAWLALPPAQARQSILSGQITGAPPQSAAPAGKLYPVSGTVYNTVTQQPVPRALVHVNSGQQQYSAFTGADGRFHIDSVVEGQAWISAQRPGFSDPSAVPGANFRGPGPGFAVGSGTNNVRLPLIPNGSITGKVIDSDGEPIVGLSVMVERPQINNGRKRFNQNGGAVTDDEGVYRIEDCQPGQAFVYTAVYSRANGSLVYAPRFFPDNEDRSSAQPFTLAAGQEADADFHLNPSRVFTVSGIVTGVDAGANATAWIGSHESMETPVASGTISPANGRLLIRGVPEGVWDLHIQTWGATQPAQRQATQEIVVKGVNLTNVRVDIKDPVKIPVVFHTNTQSPGAGAQPLQVHLFSVDAANGYEYYSSFTPPADPNQPPAVSLDGVAPGHYRVAVQAMGGTGCVESVFYGSADAAREPLAITADSAPESIVVNTRNDCATLNVEVHAPSNIPSAQVLLLPETLPLEPMLMQVNPGGAVLSFSNVSPGSYKLIAAADLSQLEYMNPEAMRDVPSQEIKLDPNQNATVKIEAADRAKP